MSKIQTKLDKEWEKSLQEDLSWEHSQHNVAMKNCSNCWAEKLIVKYSPPIEEIKERTRRALSTDIYGCSPWDQNPLG